MYKKSLIGMLVLMAGMFLAAQNSFAQGNPCLLNVGDCPADQGGGTRYYEGAQAREIMSFLNYGSRYLLRLNEPYRDPNSNCMAEDRAWVSTVTANDGNKIAIKVGPARKVLFCAGMTTPTVQQINNAEAYIQYSRNWLYELQKNPSRYANAQGWINYYNQYIAQQQTFVAQGAPR